MYDTCVRGVVDDLSLPPEKWAVVTFTDGVYDYAIIRGASQPTLPPTVQEVTHQPWMPSIDGSFIFAPEADSPEAALKRIQDEAILEIRDATHRYILHNYPEWKQCNIIRIGDGYTQEDLDHMAQFIDEARVLSNQAEKAVGLCTSQEKVTELMETLHNAYSDDIPV